MKNENGINAIKRNDTIYGWLFISPLLIGFTLFVAFPIIMALFLTVCEYDLFNAPKIVGFINIKNAFKDEMFLASIKNVAKFSLNVPFRIALALILANLLVRNKRGSMVYRLIYYIPPISGAVAVTFIWGQMYASEIGLLSSFLAKLNIYDISFLDKKNFITSMSVMSIWGGLGVSIIMLYATLRNVPLELYEASELDGANAFSKFFHITIPGVSMILFYLFITGFIGSFQEFTSFQVMRGGSVSYETITPVWWIYKFTQDYGYQYGYASALGVLFGLVLIVISAAQFIISKYWVNYDY